ncbi:hypothetical protein BKA69DRAFT_1125752 [Paraphysoderma sedebokerense]|nr:hypothetical protein BKA69DRAFT_1125752 [Paraphysoderma sedebokerense]
MSNLLSFFRGGGSSNANSSNNRNNQNQEHHHNHNHHNHNHHHHQQHQQYSPISHNLQPHTIENENSNLELPNSSNSLGQPQSPASPFSSNPGSPNSRASPSSGGNAVANGDTPRIRIVPVLNENFRGLSFPIVERSVPNGLTIRIKRYVDKPGLDFTNCITFRSKVVSRQHAELWSEGDNFYIRDTKSSSGTFINNVRISPANQESKPFLLKDGDVVQLGVDYQGRSEDIFKCVRMRVEINREKMLNRNSQYRAQVIKALKTLALASNNTSGDCCICLSKIAPLQALFIAPCCHSFHFRCVRPLLGGWPNFLCPLCRNFADLEASVSTENLDIWADECGSGDEERSGGSDGEGEVEEKGKDKSESKTKDLDESGESENENARLNHTSQEPGQSGVRSPSSSSPSTEAADFPHFPEGTLNAVSPATLQFLETSLNSNTNMGSTTASALSNSANSRSETSNPTNASAELSQSRNYNKRSGHHANGSLRELAERMRTNDSDPPRTSSGPSNAPVAQSESTSTPNPLSSSSSLPEQEPCSSDNAELLVTSESSLPPSTGPSKISNGSTDKMMDVGAIHNEDAEGRFVAPDSRLDGDAKCGGGC